MDIELDTVEHLRLYGYENSHTLAM